MEKYAITVIQRKGYFKDDTMTTTYRLHASSRKKAVATVKKCAGIHLLHITKVAIE